MKLIKVEISGVQGAARSLPDSKGSAFGGVWGQSPTLLRRSAMGEFKNSPVDCF